MSDRVLTAALGTAWTYFKQTVPVRLAIADGAGVTVPPERAARLDALAAQLEGFEVIGRAAPADPDARQTTFAAILANHAEATCAWVIDMTQGEEVASFVELTTEWEDGTVVATVTSTLPSVFDMPARVRHVQLPGAGAAEALATHREACLSVPGLRVDPTARDPLVVAQEQNEELLEHQARAGVLRRRGADYGFTWGGARRAVSRLLAAG